MKKLLGILVLGLLVCNVGLTESKNLKYYLKHKNLGLDKKDLTINGWKFYVDTSNKKNRSH